MKIKISLFTYLFIILVLLSGYIKVFLGTVLILFIHELGHLLFIKLFHVELLGLTIYFYGGKLTINKMVHSNNLEDLLISSGGILFQLVLAFIFYFFKINNLFNLNLIVLIFNILPIYPLDGYYILTGFLRLILPFKRVYKLSYYLNFIFIIILSVTFLYFNIINYFLIFFFLIYQYNLYDYINNILIKYLMEEKYIK